MLKQVFCFKSLTINPSLKEIGLSGTRQQLQKYYK